MNASEQCAAMAKAWDAWVNEPVVLEHNAHVQARERLLNAVAKEAVVELGPDPAEWCLSAVLEPLVEALGHVPSAVHVYRALLLAAERAVEDGAVDAWEEFEREDLRGELDDRRGSLYLLPYSPKLRGPWWLAEFARS